MGREVRVAIGQTGPVGDDKEQAVKRLAEMAGRAGDDGVRMLLFPELALTPFFPRELVRDFEHWFDERDSAIFAPLLERARASEMVIVVPYAEKAGPYFYNSALVIDADGTVAGNYRKVHIPAYFPSDLPGATGSFEKLYFRPGDGGFPVFDTAYGRVGVQICYDRMFPEGSRTLALHGAELVFFPHNYASYGMDYRNRAWGRLIQARTYENGFFGLVSNRTGTEGTRQSAGRSMIVSPFGGDIVAEAGGDGEEILTATLDLDDVLEARRRLPWWRDRRPETYRDLSAPDRGARP